jgi:hypothetical protein
MQERCSDRQRGSPTVLGRSLRWRSSWGLQWGELGRTLYSRSALSS